MNTSPTYDSTATRTPDAATTGPSTLLADPEHGRLDDIVDVERYPLDRPGSASWTDLVDELRTDLTATGCVTLRDLLLPRALASAAAEVRHIAEHVPILRQHGTVYARTELEAELPPDDPRRRRLTWHAGHITRDMIPPYSALHRLYASSAFKAFVAAVVGRPQVFEYADPLAGLVVTILPPGGSYPWHYDTNEFVVTIMTQAPDVGGRFEYHQDLRSPGDENLAGLAEVLRGEPARQPRSLTARPGDLQLFLGRYSLHQVTEVAGLTDRHVAVLSYAAQPGVIGPADRTRRVYGRVTEAHLLADQRRLAAEDGLIL